MQIDKKLNLVLEIEREDGTVIHVHSTPIRKEVFASNHRVIAKTFARIYGDGLGTLAGPRVAALVMREIAETMGGADSLFNEINRLTTVLVPSSSGWDSLPLPDAIARKLLSDDEASEVENAVAFFIVASAMHKRPELKAVMDVMHGIWGGQTVLSTSTEFAASLPTSTAVASSGETVRASSIPS